MPGYAHNEFDHLSILDFWLFYVANVLAQSHFLRRLECFVRAFPANIVDACDDEQPPILEQCLKHHDKVSCTETEPFEYAAHQVSFQPDTVEATHIPGP